MSASRKLDLHLNPQPPAEDSPAPQYTIRIQVGDGWSLNGHYTNQELTRLTLSKDTPQQEHPHG